MTDSLPPSWINKGQPRSNWPEWVQDVATGRPEANGSFMIRSRHGQARVHKGAMCFRYGGNVYTCPPGDAREMLAGLRAEDDLTATAPPPRTGKHERVMEADTADRRDDTDDIGARIRAAEEIGRQRQKSAQKAIEPPAKEITATRAVPAPAIVLTGRIAPAVGTMPSIEWIQLGRLLVDDSYQRSVDTGPSRALIARIGRSWDWRLCVPLMVSRRPDGLYVIDGQHRLFGARLRSDVPQLPCCISVYDGPADEAAMFVAANRERRAMNRLDDFHAAQAGGNEEALAVAALITGAGFTVSRKTRSGAWAPGEVAFTSAIAKARRRYGDPIASDALDLLAQAFPRQRLTVGSSIFTATASVLGAPPPDFRRSRLLAALRTFDMVGWGSFINASKGGSDRAKHLREMLLEAYVDAGKAER